MVIRSLLLGLALTLGPPAESTPVAPPAEEETPEDAPPPAETDAPAEDAPAPEGEPSPADAGPPVVAEPDEVSGEPPVEEPPVEETPPEEEPPADTPAEEMSKLPPPPLEEDMQPQSDGEPKPAKRPVQYPKLWLSFGIGPGRRAIGFGVGVTYFFIPYLGIGLDLDDTIVFDPGGTYNVFDLTPTLTILPMPRFRATPVIKGGFGGEFISSNLGNYGRWVVQGGVAFKIGRRFFAMVLVGPDGRVPDSRWRQNFTCGFTNNPCSLGLVIDLGFGFGFG